MTAASQALQYNHHYDFMCLLYLYLKTPHLNP